LPALAQPSTTEFTYQGVLQDGGGPVSDTCAFNYALFDAATAGTQIGATLARPGVVVTNGLFAVKLDFGSGAFSSTPRFLEIAVKCSGDAVFQTLLPR